MASDGLVEAFTRLSTSDSRLNALEALIKELTPYEWRFVQSLTSTRTFQFDIIGRLPAELVSYIFSYSDTSTPWRLQHVSRSWCDKLRSLPVLTPSLHSWYDGTINFRGADLNFCSRKARSIHAFRNASPSCPPDSSFKVSTPFGLTQHALAGDNLIWLAQDRRQVHVLNLRSLKPKVLVPMTRETIGNVYAADEIVAFSAQARGIIFVGELNGHDPVKSFRFTNPGLRFTFTCRRRTVACAENLHDHTLVYIWNYDTQQGRSFNVNNNRLPIPIAQVELGLLLQPDTETIMLCQFVAADSRSRNSLTELRYYRFTYAGECIDSATQLLYESEDDRRVEFGDRRSISFIPASHDGLYMLQCHAWNIILGLQTVRTLHFDELAHAFTRPQHPRLSPIDSFDQANVVWWKDTFVEAGTKERIIVHRGTIAAPRLDPAVAYNHLKPMQRTDKEWQVHYKDLLINDKYIVRPYCDAFYVYCYDHTVLLPGKAGTLEGVGPWEVIEPSFASVEACRRGIDGR